MLSAQVLSASEFGLTTPEPLHHESLGKSLGKKQRSVVQQKVEPGRKCNMNAAFPLFISQSL